MAIQTVAVELRHRDRFGTIATSEIEGVLIRPNYVLLPEDDSGASFAVSMCWKTGEDGKWWIDLDDEEYVGFDKLTHMFRGGE